MIKKLVDVHVYRYNQKAIEFLILKRAPNTIYKGSWRMVAGKVNMEETYMEAAIRELNEEIGAKPLKIWSAPTINSFYEPQTDLILHTPVIAVEIDVKHNIVLNHEHNRYKWVTLSEVDNFILWPNQKNAIYLIHNLILKTNNQLFPEWLYTDF